MTVAASAHCFDPSGIDWLDALLAAGGHGEPAVLVTIVAAYGSAPRAAGAKMTVRRHHCDGTIGGGHLELQAIRIARDMLAGAPATLRRFPLGAALGQCCGGAVELMFEPVAPDARWPRLVREACHGSGCVVISRAADPRPEQSVAIDAPVSAPDSKLVASARDRFGTLGDSSLDAAALTIAHELIGADHAVMRRIGEFSLVFDPVRTARFNLLVFGAGHVGHALVRALTGVACSITWVDQRADLLPRSSAPNLRAVVTDCPDDEVDQAPPGSFFLVMTHSHALDQQLAERILARDDFAFFGLIGSRTKRRLFERRLSARGITARQLAKMTCPIGVAGIDDKAPAVIALSVAAQLLQAQQTVAGSGRRGASVQVTDLA